MEKILSEARSFTCSQAASLYIKSEMGLHFAVSQNEILQRNCPENQKFIFSQEILPVSSDSIAGYVALTGKLVNVANVYEIPENAPYRFNPSFDKANNYQSISMLVVPMKDIQDEIIGVLALINAQNQQKEIIPFDHQYEFLVLSLASQAAVAYINANLTKKLKEAYLDTIFRLAIAAECKEPDIKGHLERISFYSMILAEELGLSSQEIENIRYASPMHDIGKIGIPDTILFKPAKLTEEEYEEIKKHTIYGAKILANSKVEILQISEQIALTHHENFDGTGYPQCIKGEKIFLPGRIVTLADVFDALATKRYYKESWDFATILEYIKERSGTQFDPMVVEAFLRRFKDFIEINENYPKE
ncbi:MAG: GAF domain-containing protein [Candidatus Brocadiae bacterium]|nr:GAF domain-containing protein [Candidatus Brocadiia bacterium]